MTLLCPPAKPATDPTSRDADSRRETMLAFDRELMAKTVRLVAPGCFKYVNELAG